MPSEKETGEEIWWKDHTAEEITKCVGRRVDPNAVSINKTTVAFGRNFVSVFEGAKSVIIKTLKNYQGE
jgi:hypothetical protein